MMVLHESKLGFPLILAIPGYLTAYTSILLGCKLHEMLLTLHTDHAAYTLNGNFVVINGNTFNFYFDYPLYAYLHSLVPRPSVPPVFEHLQYVFCLLCLQFLIACSMFLHIASDQKLEA